MSEQMERLQALADTVRWSIRDEQAQSYTLNLAEMYVLLDGAGGARCLEQNEEVDVAEIARLRQRVAELEADRNWPAMHASLCNFLIKIGERVSSDTNPVGRIIRCHEDALADNARLQEALEGVKLTDRTPYYEHHEPRPDGVVPRDGKDRGTCWLTPREIAQRALALTEPSK